MSVELYLARRYLLDRRHGAWGWLISLLATGSVALGVAALIVTMAIMTGFRDDIRNKMLGVNPHIILSSFTGKMDPSETLVQKSLDENPAVEHWAPYVAGQILIGKGKNSTGASIKGIDPQKEVLVAHLDQNLIDGSWNSLSQAGGKEKKRPSIILGQELARRVGARVGDVIWIITPSSIGLTSFSIPKAHLFKVTGLIKTGLYDYDSVLTFTTIPAAQNLYGLEAEVTGFGIRIKNPDSADQVAKELRLSLQGGYWVRSWLSMNKNLFSALKLERIVMGLILALLTVVASFMIVSNLLLNISHKTKEIGILRAMGATANAIHKIFLYQGLLMGFIGNILGVFLGIGISLALAHTNFIQLPADVYYIENLPIRLLPLDIFLVMVSAALIVLIATLYPASKAAKLDPLEAIRYG